MLRRELGGFYPLFLEATLCFVTTSLSHCWLVVAEAHLTEPEHVAASSCLLQLSPRTST